MSVSRFQTASVLGVGILCSLQAGSSSNAALVGIDDVMVVYTQQDPGSTKGRVEFNVKFAGLEGDPGGFDFFSVQVRLARAGSSAAFTLSESTSENTAAIGNYWLPNVPTGNQNASTQAGEFRFQDFVSISESITPVQGQTLARFALSFESTSPLQWGSYAIEAGNVGFNKFGRDIIGSFSNRLNPGEFEIIPEPATSVLFLLAGAVVVAGRRSRRTR